MKDTPINYENESYILELYEQYLNNPSSVDAHWQAFFQGLDFTGRGIITTEESVIPAGPEDVRILRLRRAFEDWGHLAADLNPMVQKPPVVPELSLEACGFSENERSNAFPTCGILPQAEATLNEIHARLQAIYNQGVGWEASHCSPEIAAYVHEILRQEFPQTFSAEEKSAILDHLRKAKFLESFLSKKFVGVVRFSIEGGETLIPLLAGLFETAVQHEVQTAVLCMAHRGRLNVLGNLLGKPYSLLFSEFNTAIPYTRGNWDVKYHKGYSADCTLPSGQSLKVTMLPNPSHLESINPVLMGFAKGLQRQRGTSQTVLPIMVHGDASVCGQGVVYEVMQLCNLKGYEVGGTVHIIVNNQIGYTATPSETRSTRYCSDIAKTFGAPVFHVNADNPEECITAIRIAGKIRQEKGIDVFIDLNCHRLYGHNEADEPRYTNPQLYEHIKARPHIYEIYRQKLLKDQVLEEEEVRNREKALQALLEKHFEEAERFNAEESAKVQSLTQSQTEEQAQEMHKLAKFDSIDTAISQERYHRIGEVLSTIPEAMKLHPRLRKLFSERKTALLSEQSQNIDWASAEALGYASLLEKGVPVRVSGQDSVRGTFSHRHAIIFDQQTQEAYIPLDHVGKDQAKFSVYNSALSEFAVMGFEFGYSLGFPKSLVIWEAQFGDFANGAQVVIDQYVSNSEAKWGRNSSLVLYLPGGYEGIGPEHCSIRLERFLQLSANQNWRICYPTQASQLFHLIRLQSLANSRKKPLIVCTPKSMLRLAASFSNSSDLTSGKFQEFLLHPKEIPPKVRRVLLCTGKIFYDLLAQMEAEQVKDVLIIRVEQLYPLDVSKLEDLLKKVKSYKDLVWVQEEPQNQGAWQYIKPFLQKVHTQEKTPVRYVGRAASDTTESTFGLAHKEEQVDIARRALISKRSEEKGYD